MDYKVCLTGTLVVQVRDRLSSRMDTLKAEMQECAGQDVLQMRRREGVWGTVSGAAGRRGAACTSMLV
jgi:hypothetical protein